MSTKGGRPSAGFYEGTMMYEVTPGTAPVLDSWRDNTVEAIATRLTTYLDLINRQTVVIVTVVDPSINAVIISLEDRPERLIKHLQSQINRNDASDFHT